MAVSATKGDQMLNSKSMSAGSKEGETSEEVRGGCNVEKIDALESRFLLLLAGERRMLHICIATGGL